jgi:hypothetical protein
VRVDRRREVVGLDPGEQPVARAVGLVLRRIELVVLLTLEVFAAGKDFSAVSF